jgi:geranylgeranyl diphosphate synthase type II
MSDNTEFRKELEERTKQINEQIESYLPEEKGHQKTIFEAMNYSVKAGGKRLRPLFMQEICRLFTGEVQPVVVPFMAAIEMIHTSSLVHDDLPCMDDDMMRRGQASTWAEYGEDMGVLAGDALMIYAFEVAAKAFKEVSDADDLKRVGRAIEILASKTGIYGMIGGQTVDVELAGGPIPKNKLDFIYRLKTGALIEASMLIGAVLGGAAEEDCKIVESLAGKVGLAFQIQDDILDVISTTEVLGKPVHSDEKNEKMTYVVWKGLDVAKQEVEHLSRKAISDVRALNPKDDYLEILLESLIYREK